MFLIPQRCCSIIDIVFLDQTGTIVLLTQITCFTVKARLWVLRCISLPPDELITHVLGTCDKLEEGTQSR